MGLVLGQSDGHLNRRTILRAGISGLGLHGLVSGGSQAFGQVYRYVDICAMGFIGSTMDPNVFYYYGVDCYSSPDYQYYGITSPTSLTYCEDCTDDPASTEMCDCFTDSSYYGP